VVLLALQATTESVIRVLGVFRVRPVTTVRRAGREKTAKTVTVTVRANPVLQGQKVQQDVRANRVWMAKME